MTIFESGIWENIGTSDSLEKRMLTRREILAQLRRVGVVKHSELKQHCREFEQYMLVNYGNGILKEESNPPPTKLTRRMRQE